MLTSSQSFRFWDILQESPGESRIDKMRKFLSSPLTRKKTSGLQVKTFGTPLDTLLQKTASEHSVPFVIIRLCQYILKSGLTHEGLFRISGNARSVERLKASFDRTGDAPLETDGDVPTAAALLKLFLRELPDPIIPTDMHCRFVDAVKDKEKKESIPQLTELVERLPPVNYHILSYLFSFLKKVSDMEDHNRMSASSLGIVFGPNLFRVTEDFVGLKEQSFTNQIVTYFITDHQEIFRNAKFSYSSCYAEVINKTSQQVATMVSSWPEGRGSSSSMLSTWSLGPISVPHEPTTDDSFYSLKSLSQTMIRTETTDSGFTSLKLDDTAYSTLSESDFKLCKKDANLDICNSPRNQSKECNNAVTSSPRDSKEHKSSLSLGEECFMQEYYIMEEPPLLCHTSLAAPSSSSTDFSYNHEGNSSHSPKSLGLAFKNINLQHDFSPEALRCTFNNLEHQSNSAQEKPEEMLKDVHKSYPRGRRRHVRHHKSKSHGDERLLGTAQRSHQEDRELNGDFAAEGELPADEMESQHMSTGSFDESKLESRHSWPAFRKCAEEEDIALSPLPQQLEVTVGGEASISPSAYRSYLSHRNLHLDPSLPPSPPVEQEDLATGSSLEEMASSSKQLSKKVHALKKKIRMFEENFEKLYGYKPSHAEKCCNIAVRKMLSELNKARQDLKQLKEDPLLWNTDDSLPAKTSRAVNTKSSQGLFSTTAGSASSMSIEDTIRDSQAFLTRHRKEENRPEDLDEMSREQLVSEKVAIQKVLLNFESLHGRPSSKVHRELVRPLYDRYRNTKRLIARSADADLMPILENETMDFKKSEQAMLSTVDKNDDYQSGKVTHGGSNDDQLKASISSHINLHELSRSELESELNFIREEKRRLRKLLKDFEEVFKKEHGRKAQREDKRAMESCYTEYKNAKSKLKLLEALVAKQELNS